MEKNQVLILFQIINSDYVKIDPNNVEYEYSISISSVNESQGYIYIPFIENNKFKDSIFKDLKSKYPKSINSIVQTKYGTALNISFEFTFELRYGGKIDKHINLGMLDYNESRRKEIIKIFIKLDKNDLLNIDFSWNLDGGGSGDTWKFNGEIEKDGWNSIEGRASSWSD